MSRDHFTKGVCIQLRSWLGSAPSRTPWCLQDVHKTASEIHLPVRTSRVRKFLSYVRHPPITKWEQHAISPVQNTISPGAIHAHEVASRATLWITCLGKSALDRTVRILLKNGCAQKASWYLSNWSSPNSGSDNNRKISILSGPILINSWLAACCRNFLTRMPKSWDILCSSKNHRTSKNCLVSDSLRIWICCIMFVIVPTMEVNTTNAIKRTIMEYTLSNSLWGSMLVTLTPSWANDQCKEVVYWYKTDLSFTLYWITHVLPLVQGLAMPTPYHKHATMWLKSKMRTKSLETPNCKLETSVLIWSCNCSTSLCILVIRNSFITLKIRKVRNERPKRKKPAVLCDPRSMKNRSSQHKQS